MNYYVYGHYCVPTNKWYIGQTRQNPEIRWGTNGKNYLKKRKNGCFNQPKFANAIIKYGWLSFKHYILATCTETDVDNIERYFINKHNSINNGYNLESGGNKNKKLSNETKTKISLTNKIVMNSPEIKKKQSENQKLTGNHNYGKKLSEETKRKLSIAHKGLLSGNKHPKFGTKLSDKQKESLRQGNIKKWLDGRDGCCKKVLCIETGECFKSLADASRKFNINRSSISNQIAGKSKTAGGYQWELI